jgi:hypothetical protein
MGSQEFKTYGRGKSVEEAYNRAVEDAEDQYGHQEGYSGEINSTPGYTDVTAKFKASKKSLDEYINERLNVLTKHHGAEAICIEEPKVNTNKIKTQVEHVVTPGTKKWVLHYTVEADIHVGSFLTKGEAVKKGRAYTEKTGKPSRVKMEKRLEKVDATVAKITYKKSTNEKDGRWLFYGWASC